MNKKITPAMLEISAQISGIDSRWPQTRSGPLSISEQIAAELGHRIVIGVYAPGERLLEQQISDEFQVSRNPVREALRMLENDGYIDVLPRRGAQVADVDDEEVAEIFDVAVKLFELMAIMLAKSQSREAAETIDDAVAFLEDNLEADGAVNAHVYLCSQLSVVLANMSRSKTLSRLIARLTNRVIGPTRQSLVSVSRRRDSIDNWRNLGVAIKSGDVAAAQEAAGRLVYSAATARG